MPNSFHVAFFGDVVGADEVFLILIIVLLLFGADRLPEIARSIGRALEELRRASDTFRDELISAEKPKIDRPTSALGRDPQSGQLPPTAANGNGAREQPPAPDRMDHPDELAG